VTLNLGCGSVKIPNCVNVDVSEECKPDVVADFKKRLPFPDDSVEKVLFFHVIEHIEEKYHDAVFDEIHRVLKPEGTLLISFPEFLKVAENYRTNHLGMRDFWKATIYGRQLYSSDYHVSLMDSSEFKIRLEERGFTNVAVQSEKREPWNTVVSCKKGAIPKSYEEILAEEIFGVSSGFHYFKH
jgi:SAM-dependent methyltransferase